MPLNIVYSYRPLGVISPGSVSTCTAVPANGLLGLGSPIVTRMVSLASAATTLCVLLPTARYLVKELAWRTSCLKVTAWRTGAGNLKSCITGWIHKGLLSYHMGCFLEPDFFS